MTTKIDLRLLSKNGMEEMFSDANIGDKVWDYRLGWGVIVNLDFSDYPIIVDFPDGGNASYTLSGLEYVGDANPSLFWDVVTFKIPRKPPAMLDVDDKVVVWNDGDEKCNRYFSHFSEDGIFHTFYGGETSFSSGGQYSAWDNWESVEDK